eukprot:1356278-Pyramimonas_sp.AAC.1
MNDVMNEWILTAASTSRAHSRGESLSNSSSQLGSKGKQSPKNVLKVAASRTWPIDFFAALMQ